MFPFSVAGSRAVAWWGTGTSARLMKFRLHQGPTCEERMVHGPAFRTQKRRHGHGHGHGPTLVVDRPTALEQDELELLRTVMLNGREEDSSLRSRGRKEKGKEKEKGDGLASAVAALPPRLTSLVTSLKSFDDTFNWARQMVLELQNPDGEGSDGSAWETLTSMPPTTFSELLRSLDPVMAAKTVDPAAGVYINHLRARTTLGHMVGRYGIRHIYRNLRELVFPLAEYRMKAGFLLSQSDFKVMLRCAGATSDIFKAKQVWHIMEATEAHHDRDGSSYAEFIKARFLTEPLYSAFDLSRLRVRPINLTASKRKRRGFPSKSAFRVTMRTLRYMRRDEITSQVLQFGQVPDEDRMRSLTRLLMWSKPVTEVWSQVRRADHKMDEDLFCAAMVAYARSASMQAFQRLLFKHYRILVRKDKKTGAVLVADAGVPVYAPDSPMYPTEKLLEAVVEAYCSNAEMGRAAKVVALISTRYGLPVPDRLWHRLLEWAYVLASLPASREWTVSGLWPEKVVTFADVHMVWDAMMAHGTRPGFGQYEVLINLQLSRNRVAEALTNMMELEPFYRSLQPGLEAAFFEEAAAAALGVTSPARSWFGDGGDRDATWAVARVRKDVVFSTFQQWCHSVFKRIPYTERPGDWMAVRLVPQVVDKFRDVLPTRVHYRVATGKIQIVGMQPVQRMQYVLEPRSMPPATTGDVLSPRALTSSKVGLRRRRRVERAYMWVPRLLTRPLEPAALACMMPSREELQRQFT